MLKSSCSFWSPASHCVTLSWFSSLSLICRAAPGSSLCSCNELCQKLSTGRKAARTVTQLGATATHKVLFFIKILETSRVTRFPIDLLFFCKQKKLHNSPLHRPASSLSRIVAEVASALLAEHISIQTSLEPTPTLQSVLIKPSIIGVDLLLQQLHHRGDV